MNVTNEYNGIFSSVDLAIKASMKANELLLNAYSINDRNKLIKMIRKLTKKLAMQLAQMTVEETGMGNVTDKIKKHYLVANKTPGCEILKPLCFSGDCGLTLIERAPFGVIAAITPSTNATETILCNSIGMLAGGNTVVFNVHPAAKKVSLFLINMLNKVILDLGGPPNLIVMIDDPNIISANELMLHRDVALIVVTGGPAVVKAAMSSGKRAICGGPGNPPVVVDQSANLKLAASSIISGSSLDNNIVCIAEKEIFCMSNVADTLKEYMKHVGAVELTKYEIRKLEKLILNNNISVNKNWIGKDAYLIAKAIGKSISVKNKILLCEVDSEKHPFIINEMLMPVLPLLRVSNIDDAMNIAVMSEHGYKHTASIYSQDISILHKMSCMLDCSIFVKNGSNYNGLGMNGEGYTSFTIASPTGEGITTALSFTRERRCVLKDYFRVV